MLDHALYRLIGLLYRRRLRIEDSVHLRFRWSAGSIQIGKKFSTRCDIIIDAQNGHAEIGNNVSPNDFCWDTAQ